MLQGSSYAFHDVSFNPVDPQLVVTANQNEGVSLLDYRKLNKPIMKYGSKFQQKSSKISAMSAKRISDFCPWTTYEPCFV